MKLRCPACQFTEGNHGSFKKLNAEGITIVQISHSKKNAADGNHFIQLGDGWIVELRNLNH